MSELRRWGRKAPNSLKILLSQDFQKRKRVTRIMGMKRQEPGLPTAQPRLLLIRVHQTIRVTMETTPRVMALKIKLAGTNIPVT